MHFSSHVTSVPRKKLLRFGAIILWSAPLLAIILIVINTFCEFLPGAGEPIDTKNIPILNPDTSIRVHANVVAVHNSTLISVLQANLSMDNAQRASQETTRMQIRLFYEAILAVLASIFLAKSKDSSLPIGLVILFFIVFVYALEIHRDDLDKRAISAFYIKGAAVNSLVNSSPSNTTWYHLVLDSLQQQMETAHKPENRLRRKFLAACQPNLEQMAFYLFPWVAVYAVGTVFEIRKRRRVTNRPRQRKWRAGLKGLPFPEERHWR